MNQAERYLV
jgi:hypothetical protein